MDEHPMPAGAGSQNSEDLPQRLETILVGLKSESLWAAACELRDQAEGLRARRRYPLAEERRRTQLEVAKAIYSTDGVSTALLNMLIGIYRALGDQRRAWRVCLMSLDVDPGTTSNRPAWTCKGALLRQAGAFEESVDLLEGLHEEAPDDRFVLKALITACGELALATNDHSIWDRALTYASRLAVTSGSKADPMEELRELKKKASTPREATAISCLIEHLVALDRVGR
jgi:hypothetical protein